jgi:hypothetical protein
MPNFQFTGDYQSNVTLPDLSVVLVEPGEIRELPFDEPGVMWIPVTKTAAAKALSAAKAAAAANTEVAAAEAAPPTPAVVADPNPAQPDGGTN